MRPWSGALPECAARPVADHLQGPGGLAPDHHALLAAGAALTGLEAQAGVVVREPLRVHERRDPPLLVADQQDRELGERLRVARERAGDAEREDHAALHVGGAGPVEAVAVAAQRLVRIVADHGVDVAEQHHPPAPGPGHGPDQIWRAAGRRARRSLHLGAVGQQRRT